MIQVELVIEKGIKSLWGTVKYNNNLLIDSGDNLVELETKLRALLQEFEHVNPKVVLFKYTYDVLR